MPKIGGLGVADMFVLNITAAFHGHSVTCGVTKSVIISSLDKEEESLLEPSLIAKSIVIEITAESIFHSECGTLLTTRHKTLLMGFSYN